MSHVLGMEEKCCEPHSLPSFPTLVPCRTAGLALPAQPHTSTMGPAQSSLREGSAHRTASPCRLTPQQEPELSSVCCQFVGFCFFFFPAKSQTIGRTTERLTLEATSGDLWLQPLLRAALCERSCRRAPACACVAGRGVCLHLSASPPAALPGVAALSTVKAAREVL